MQRRFLYFLPGVGAVSEQMLADRGLLGRFTDAGTAIERCYQCVTDGPSANGESAGGGCIVAAGPNPPSFDATRQQWMKGLHDVWCGIEDLPPRPADVQRTMGLGGYRVTLGDGGSWIVPRVHRWDEQLKELVTCLPTSLQPTIVNGRYRFRQQVRGDYARLDAIARQTFESMVTESRIELETLFGNAAELLGANYRVGIEELSLLGALDTESCSTVLTLAIDEPAIARMAAAAGVGGMQIFEHASDSAPQPEIQIEPEEQAA